MRKASLGLMLAMLEEPRATNSIIKDFVRLIQTHHPEVFLTLTDFILSTEDLAHDQINVLRTVYGDFLLLA